jgi:hypothetical protein
VGQGFFIIQASQSHSVKAHHNRQDSSGRVIGPSQRALPHNIQHSQKTHTHAPPEFQPAIPASEPPQTHALDRVAFGMREMYIDQRNPNERTGSAGFRVWKWKLRRSRTTDGKGRRPLHNTDENMVPMLLKCNEVQRWWAWFLGNKRLRVIKKYHKRK